MCDNGLRGMADDALNSSDPLRSHGERPCLHLVWEYVRQYQAGGRGRWKAHQAGGCFPSGPQTGREVQWSRPGHPATDQQSRSRTQVGRDCPARVRVILSPRPWPQEKETYSVFLFHVSGLSFISVRRFPFSQLRLSGQSPRDPSGAHDSAADRETGSPETDGSLSCALSQQGPAFLGQNPQGVGVGGVVLSSKACGTDSGAAVGPSGMSGGEGASRPTVSPDVPFVVQVLRRVRLFATRWTAAHQASLSITSSQSMLKLMSFQSVMPSNRLTLCRPPLLPPSVFPSIKVFANEWLLASGALNKSLSFFIQGMQIPKTSVPGGEISDG